MSFGSRLRQLRLENNMTQEILSKKLNISRAAVGRYETNERFPDKDTLKNIANIFNVSIDYLLEQTNLRNYNFISKEPSWELYNHIDDFKFIYEEIKNELIMNNIITKEEMIPKEIVENIVHYGIDAAIKIYLLEEKLNNKKESD